MATNTTNYNLTKQEPTEYYDVGVVNDNLDKIDTAIKVVDTQLTQHLAQDNDVLITVTRDISLSGVQVITAPFEIKSAVALAVIDDTQVSADCLWNHTNGGRCVFDTSTYKFGAGHFLQLSTATGNYVIANIQNVTETNFELNWSNAGGITGTVKIYILARAH